MRASNDLDGLTSLIFSPDPVSCFQHEKVYGAQRGSADEQALRALMLAVLEDAIACYQGYFFMPSRTNENRFLEAEEWINSNNAGVFSFNNICETLGLVPERLRKGLLLWKTKQTGVPPEERKRLILSKGKRIGKRGKAA